MLATDKECTAVRGKQDEHQFTIDDWLSAAAVLAAGWNVAQMVSTATDEWDLAKRYWRISNNWQSHYKDFYAPVEDQEIAEALALEEEQPEYDRARARAHAAAWLEFRGVLEKNTRCLSEYCTGLRADIITELASAEAQALVLADGLGYRNERAYIESRDDVRFQKQMNTAKRGRDMVAENVSLAKTTAGIYADTYQQAWEGLKGCGYYLGYKANRIEPSYPTTFLGRMWDARAGSARYTMGGTFNNTSFKEYSGFTNPQYVDSQNPVYDELTASGDNR